MTQPDNNGNASAKSTRGRGKRSRHRTDLSYIKSAKKLSKLAPTLAKYSGRKYRADALKGKLSAGAKAAITRKEKLLRHAENLHYVSKAQYKRAKKLGIAAEGGIQAVKLRNTEPGAKIRIDKKHGLRVGTNGRTITYKRVVPPDLENMLDAAAEVFGEEYIAYEDEDDEDNDIEIVEYNKPTRKIRRKKAHVTVWLWTIHGRASRGFRSLKLFAEDIAKAFEAYKNQEDWILGIAWLREKLSR